MGVVALFSAFLQAGLAQPSLVMPVFNSAANRLISQSVMFDRVLCEGAHFSRPAALSISSFPHFLPFHLSLTSVLFFPLASLFNPYFLLESFLLSESCNCGAYGHLMQATCVHPGTLHSP